MAVDYFHRLVITGPARDLRRLRAGLATEFARVVEGKEYKELLPFSLLGLFTLAPDAYFDGPQDASEPYDIRVWPMVRRSSRRIELRYQLHMRNDDLLEFLPFLSRKFKTLTFRMATLCLEDSEVDGFLVRDGKVNRWRLRGKRRDFHWDRAREKFKLAGDDVYEDDDAELLAEDGMLEEALDHWEPQPPSASRTRPRHWWNRPVVRDFMEQRELDVIEASEGMVEFDREERRQRRRRTQGMTSAAAAAGAPPGRPPHVVEHTREMLDAEVSVKRPLHTKGRPPQ